MADTSEVDTANAEEGPAADESNAESRWLRRELRSRRRGQFCPSAWLVQPWPTLEELRAVLRKPNVSAQSGESYLANARREGGPATIKGAGLCLLAAVQFVQVGWVADAIFWVCQVASINVAWKGIKKAGEMANYVFDQALAMCHAGRDPQVTFSAAKLACRALQNPWGTYHALQAAIDADEWEAAAALWVLLSAEAQGDYWNLADAAIFDSWEISPPAGPEQRERLVRELAIYAAREADTRMLVSTQRLQTGGITAEVADLAEQLLLWDLAAEYWGELGESSRAGQACLQLKQYDKALAHFLISADWPRAAQVKLAIGKPLEAVFFLERAGQFDEAARLLQEANQPDAVRDLWLRAAEHFVAKGRFAQAVTAYMTAGAPGEALALAGQVDDPDTLIGLYEITGKLAEACRVAEKSERYEKAEELYLRRRMPSRAARMWQEAGIPERVPALEAKAEHVAKEATLNVEAKPEAGTGERKRPSRQAASDG